MTSPADFTSSHACSSGCMSSRKRTCCRRDTDSESDEEPPPAKIQLTTDPQTSRTGGAHDGGQQFEIKMAAVTGLRGMQTGDFELATNVKDAGNFNDLVYTTNDRRYFLQLKHTEHPKKKKLIPSKLVDLLHKCFETYYNIQDRDNSEFIIHTNKQLGRKLSGHERKETVVEIVEKVFKTSANGKIFNFARDKNTKIDVYTGVEELVKDSEGFGELSVSEQNCKVSMVSKFLEKLIMVTGQKGQWKLDKVIRKEIKKGDEIKVGRKVYEQVLRNFKTQLESWWRIRNEDITPRILRNWLQESKTDCCSSLVSSLFVSCTKNLNKTEVKFTKTAISQLQAKLSYKPAVHLRSDALTLCSILLLNLLHQSKFIFVTLESLQCNENMLLYAWLGGDWECLIVSCDSTVQQSVITDTFLKFSEIIKRHLSSKRVIILTEYSVQQVTGFVPIDHKFNFEQLSKKSQGKVLDKKIDFQGCEVTMGSVLQRHGNVEHVLGPELVTELITEETAVNIGGKLCVNTGYYVPRVLERNQNEVKEESIYNLGERTVLVVAEPGMGKTSTTTQVARHRKLAYPTTWVVRINWNDHTKELDKINAATFNLDTLVEFLCNAAFPDSKYTDINRSLLKQALQSSENVTVLMDGFDEISPTYADKAAVILTELMKTKVGRVWVTSRPVQKERLEKELSVIGYGIKKLAYTSQKDMLFDLWKHKAGEEELTKSKLLELITRFLDWDLRKFFNYYNFTGCPQYITMIATVYEMEVGTCLNSEDWIEPRIDLLNLYEKFVERKLHIYLTEKQKVDITNPSVLDEHKISKQNLLMNFEKCALVAILPPDMLESLHNKKIEDEIKPFLERVVKGEDKTGIVMNVVEGNPQLIHRTFAEYFTACWFSKNFQSNRSVLEHILFDFQYQFMTYMFERMMAKDCPLHCALLDLDLGRVESLLKEGCDANAVDKGGRTVMHIIATHRMIYDKMINLLYHSGVPLDNTDCLLQWTPLQYAIEWEQWENVEDLLERNVDRSGLEMIRQRAHNTDYIDPIIIESAQQGHMLLLKFIHSIGVNIHQASSMDFPSPLHAAIQGRQLDVVRWLIKLGADCNTRYSHGQTPFFYAVTEVSLDVVRVLVEEGGASLDLRDDRGRTVIDWAKDYMSDLKKRGSIMWKQLIEVLNATVKYLQDRMYTDQQCTAE